MKTSSLEFAEFDPGRSLSSSIADEIEVRIMTGKLKGGDHLVERNLASDFCVSRQPIRDALKILEARGLVEHIPQRGMIVSCSNEKNLRGLFAIRASLEALAARFACENIASGANLSHLIRLVEEGGHAIGRHNNEAAFACNAGFHKEIIHLADNSSLTALLNSLLSHMHELSANEEHLACVHGEHVELLEAILSGDSERAENVARAHSSSYEQRVTDAD